MTKTKKKTAKKLKQAESALTGIVQTNSTYQFLKSYKKLMFDVHSILYLSTPKLKKELKKNIGNDLLINEIESITERILNVHVIVGILKKDAKHRENQTEEQLQKTGMKMWKSVHDAAVKKATTKKPEPKNSIEKLGISSKKLKITSKAKKPLVILKTKSSK